MNGKTIDGAVALVTGANRGIGRALAERLLERGAGKLYACARDPQSLADLVDAHRDRVVATRLDVTEATQIEAVVESAGDLQLLFNNAGVALGSDLLSDDIHRQARTEIEVNYLAPLMLIQRLAPTLMRNGGGAVVNIASVGGLTNFPRAPTYSASKAAVHSLTQGARLLLTARGTLVAGVYPGPVDTDMARGLAFEKATPRQVADAILDGVERGDTDIYPDAFAVEFGRVYQASPRESERAVAAMIADAAEASD